MCTSIRITTGTKVNILDLLMLFGLLPTLLGGKTEISMLGFMCKLRVVGGPLLWEALGHGLLGLGLKRALVRYYISLHALLY